MMEPHDPQTIANRLRRLSRSHPDFPWYDRLDDEVVFVDEIRKFRPELLEHLEKDTLPESKWWKNLFRELASHPRDNTFTIWAKNLDNRWEKLTSIFLELHSIATSSDTFPEQPSNELIEALRLWKNEAPKTRAQNTSPYPSWDCYTAPLCVLAPRVFTRFKPGTLSNNQQIKDLLGVPYHSEPSPKLYAAYSIAVENLREALETAGYGVPDEYDDVSAAFLSQWLTKLPRLTTHESDARLFVEESKVSSINSSLHHGNFLIFTGISGIGKTQIARTVASALTDEAPEFPSLENDEDGWGWLEERTDTDDDRVAFLPVRPNWTESSQIWGHYDPLTGTFRGTDALRVLFDAYRTYLQELHDDGNARTDADGSWNGYPSHFIILDEMNLARVEHYFSDVLSLMESPLHRRGNRLVGETAELHKVGGLVALSETTSSNVERADSSHGVPVARPGRDDREVHEQLFAYLLDGVQTLDELPDPEGDDWLRAVPPRLAWPPNLGVIGTVNVDETTYSFAPKVLDRASVIDFTEVNFERYFADRNNPDPSTEVNGGTVSLSNLLQALYEILEPANLHFGYRTADHIADVLADDCSTETFDQLLLTEVLPKLNGDEQRVGKALCDLYHFCCNGEDCEIDEHFRSRMKQIADEDDRADDIAFERSADKLHGIIRRMNATGVASFF